MRRTELLDRIRRTENWDIIVIGGGATGLGAALDASTRGYRTLLLEAHDFAQGTSSRSTKLVHGGVRYLASGQIGLVREALHERGILLKNAPHLVHSRSFLVPAHGWLTKPYYALGLKLYDLLAGRRRLGWSRMVGRAEALRLTPNLKTAGLRGGVIYQDGQFDDARLAIALLLTLLDQGGTALNQAAVTGLLKDGARTVGVVVRDAETGAEFEAKASVVINATGVFADAVRRLDDPGAATLIRPSRGIHIVLDREFLPGDTAILVPETEDGRVLFAIPWHDHVLLGTTDTPTHAVELEPRGSAEEVEYLLRYAARYLERAPGRADIRGVFAGLRPLIDVSATRSTARLSREHEVLVSDSGVVTITGGKWTTYRRMAADAVDRAAAVGGLPARACGTAELRLHGWIAPGGSGQLPNLYGSDEAAVAAVVAERAAWSERLHPAFPYRRGEVIWAARRELARNIDDVLSRRLRLRFLDVDAALECAPTVAGLLAEELGRDEAWQAEQVERFKELVRAARPDRETTRDDRQADGNSVAD